MSGEISNRRVTHLRGDDMFIGRREENREKSTGSVPDTSEVFRVISDGVRGLTKWFSEPK